jgi:plasmid stabilization system protein ParE
MRLEWTTDALSDLTHLHDFLSMVSPRAATRAVSSLIQAPERLIQFPRLGERLEQYAPHEIRRIIVADYEIRYEIKNSVIQILHLFHGREGR